MSSASTTTQHTPFGIIIRCVLALVLCLAFIPLFPQRSMAATTWSMEKSGDNYVITINTDPYFGVGQDGYREETLMIGYTDGNAASGANGYRASAKLIQDNGQLRLVNAWGADINASSATASPDFTQYTLTVPASFFANDDFTVTYADKTVASSEIPGASTPAPQPVEPTEPTEPTDPTDPTQPETPDPNPPADQGYKGIAIDGAFDDWSGVGKADIDDGKSWSTCDQVAMVWDGDWVYLYFMAYGEPYDWGGDNKGYYGNWDSITGAGPNGSGKYAITTDLGNQLLITPRNVNGEPAVAGVNGAKVAVNNKEYYEAPHMWEVAIPASELPAYSETISFGFYQMEPVIKNVADLQGSTGGEFNGIVYDGNYDDWEYYPHTTIEYATSGTQEDVVDSKGALYAEGSTLFGHVVSTMPAHVESKGGDLLAGVSITFNGDRNYKEYPNQGNFYPQMYLADSSGRITGVAGEGTRLEDGTYTVYMSDTRQGADLASKITGKTYDELTDEEKKLIFGEMKLTVTDGKIEAEFEVDLEKVAAYTGQNPDDFRLIEIQWGKLGQDWITTGGTSTAPLALGLSCAAIAVGGVALANRRRKGASGSEESQTNEMV